MFKKFVNFFKSMFKGMKKSSVKSCEKTLDKKEVMTPKIKVVFQQISSFLKIPNEQPTNEFLIFLLAFWSKVVCNPWHMIKWWFIKIKEATYDLPALNIILVI